MENDVRTVIRMENFAAFESPLPSSFETRTLHKISNTQSIFYYFVIVIIGVHKVLGIKFEECVD
uniref:Uncharacterized protein n=1 Tax=Lotus japonicus TaxID=34305 RepID=I3SNB1_LOTJA|nr:unknown [Lotus japonicus]